ncbi:MAG: hypothetical protein KDC54_07875 [Lewinella sp.]|nr:hypothetical protein [Lewinella sp.]
MKHIGILLVLGGWLAPLLAPAQSFQELEGRYQLASDPAEKIRLAIQLAEKAIGTDDLLAGNEYAESALAGCEQTGCDAATRTEAQLVKAEIKLLLGDPTFVDSLVLPLADQPQASLPPHLNARAAELAGLYYLFNGQTALSKRYLDQAESVLLGQNEHRERLVNVYEYKAFAFNFLSQYDTAVAYSLLADSLYQIAGDTMNWINSMISTSIFYRNFGKTEQSLATLMNVEELTRVYPVDRSIRLSVNSSIADAYFEQERIDQARAIWWQSAREVEQLPDEERSLNITSLWDAYASLCRVAIYKQQGDTALYYAQKTLDLVEADPALLELQVINSLMLHAEAQMTARQYPEAEAAVLRILDEYGTSADLDAFHIRIAKVLNGLYLNGNRPPNPEINQRFNPVVDRLLEKNNGLHNSVEFTAAKLRTILDLQAGSATAIPSLRHLLAVSDTLHSHALADMRSELLVAYETQEKEQTIALQDLQLHQQKNRQRWLIALILLLMGLVGLSFLYYRQKRRLAEMLEERVTERTATLRTVNQQLEQTNYELRTLNYIASHDIKEPIRNIGTFAGLIQHKLPPEWQDELAPHFTIIKRGTQQLYTLIEDFTHYTTLSRNDAALQREVVDLNELAETVKDNLHTLLAERRGTITVHDLPRLSTAPSLLTTALKNLVENGLKYNQSESPTVDISYTATPLEHHITVADNGIGIAAEYQQAIFEMFKRLHNRRTYEGSGIGLAIVKLVMDKLGGRIEVESEIGVGSRFTLAWPKSGAV